MRGENVPINGPMLLVKSHSLAIQLNSDFQPNPLRLKRMKKRENISFQNFPHDSESVSNRKRNCHNREIS